MTGGRGTLGRLLVPRLQDAGHDVIVSSRKERTPPEGVELRRLDGTPTWDDYLDTTDGG